MVKRLPWPGRLSTSNRPHALQSNPERWLIQAHPLGKAPATLAAKNGSKMSACSSSAIRGRCRDPQPNRFIFQASLKGDCPPAAVYLIALLNRLPITWAVGRINLQNGQRGGITACQCSRLAWAASRQGAMVAAASHSGNGLPIEFQGSQDAVM